MSDITETIILLINFLWFLYMSYEAFKNRDKVNDLLDVQEEMEQQLTDSDNQIGYFQQLLDKSNNDYKLLVKHFIKKWNFQKLKSYNWNHDVY